MSHTETTEAVERLVEEFDRKFPQYVELEVSSALGSRTLYATDWLRTALTTIRKETLEKVERGLPKVDNELFGFPVVVSEKQVPTKEYTNGFTQGFNECRRQFSTHLQALKK